jgi:hypothetical protein
LITGPVSRDEHWQWRDRAKDLGLSAHAEPQNYRGAALHLADKSISLSYDQQKQYALEALRFDDGATWKEMTSGKGKIFWSSYPVELAEGLDPAVSLYGFVSTAVKMKPMFELQSPIPPIVLVYGTELQGSFFYILESESSDDTPIDLRDSNTGVRLAFKLPAQRAAMALIGKREKALLAKYGF